jgi:hypothetical protein
MAMLGITVPIQTHFPLSLIVLYSPTIHKYFPTNMKIQVKFQAYAMVHHIKITFFWVITRRLVKIKKPTFQDLLFVPPSGLRNEEFLNLEDGINSKC